MVHYLIAMGGNLGASASLFQDALQKLSGPETVLRRMSRVFRTAPVGASAGEEFLNAAAIVASELSAADLLRSMQAVENSLGRQRAVRWGPRTLDLDLLLAGETVVETADLIVPHPALWYRSFVLSSAVEIAGDWQHPVFGSSLSVLQDRLQESPIRISVEFCSADLSYEHSAAGLTEDLRAQMPEIAWADGAVEGQFAHVQIFSASAEQQPYSYRIPLPGTRTIPLFVRDYADLLVQLKQLSIAIGG